MDRDWTASFSIRFRNGTCIITLDKKYNIANSSCHFGSYGSIWTGPSPKKYYMDLRSFGPYTIFLVTDRSIYCLRSFRPYKIVLVTDRSIYYNMTFTTICYLSLFLKCEPYPLASRIFYPHTPQFNASDNSIVCFLYCVVGLK
jgi:hypothetical protein